jgi:single-strand DNA-binding protein
MLNQITIMGRIVADPKANYTNGGKQVASFRVAVERDRKGPNGEREADFIDVVAWDGLAETVTKYFKKGSMIIVPGRLQIRNWKDKNGDNRSTAEVVANNVYFGESKKDSAPAAKPQFAPVEDDEGELPF